MEELKKKYEKLPDYRLISLFDSTKGDEHSIIKKILIARGVDRVEFPMDDEDVQDSIIPKSKKLSLAEENNTKTNGAKHEPADSSGKSMSKKTYAAPKSAQFYMVYYEFLSKYKSEVALLAAVLTSKQQYLQGRNKLKDGLFFLEHPKIEEITGISEHRQKKAMAILVDLKILYISPKKMRTPPKTHYRVDIDRYNDIVQCLSNEKQSQ